MADAIQPDSAQETQQLRFPEAYSVLREAIAAQAFPGCAFGMRQNGRVVLDDALGNFTYDAQSPAVTPGTMYDIASLTKVVTTTATAMLLYQRGQLDLGLPLGELLPGFVIGRDDSRLARQITGT